MGKEHKDLQVKDKNHPEQKIEITKQSEDSIQDILVKESKNKDTEDISIKIMKPKFPGGAELPDRLQKFEGQLQVDIDHKLDSEKQASIKKSLEVIQKSSTHSGSSSTSSSDSSSNETEIKLHSKI